MAKTIISADSHITEPPGCYVDHIDPKYREIAPKMVHDEGKGDVFVIHGMKKNNDDRRDANRHIGRHPRPDRG